MKADESLDTIKKLERNFDEESVKRALAALDEGAFDGWMISKLLDGRGATLLWPKIEQRLKQNLSLTNIARLADYLPWNEVTVLLDQAPIDDSQLIELIKDGRFPPIRVLPKERRERIYDNLRKIVKAESSSEHASALLLFCWILIGSLARIDSLTSNRWNWRRSGALASGMNKELNKFCHAFSGCVHRKKSFDSLRPTYITSRGRWTPRFY